MSRRQLYLGIAGLLLGVVGLFALYLPVYLNQFDSYGVKITCGNGFSSDLTQAHQANSDALASQCDTALLVRRAWAIPTVAAGWVLITGFLVIWVHNDQNKKQEVTYTG
ncbi:hypothetical protein MSIMFB_00630 [Mycobacterium simulans]|uniref:Transmembrane protein n=1 Tax=Mycobacterium simulans TaxID=627089 RepID=A0A7Z7IGL6_9MYCO|nr:hypothetical protein [Mycobacterium simulans]SOJ53129.1 hypothetical protein MSIMFB_00630 [Mycobacterium simulans]SON59134.1 hypothetical protein MSIMFI_00616 [Mycobacterium simulans]